MLSIISKNIAIITLFFFALSSPLQAEEKGKYFQKWEEKSQIGFVSTSVLMALTIASQTDKELMRCIDDWYGEEEDENNHRLDEILKTIRENVKYEPNAVLLALIFKACGRFPAK